MTTTLTIPNKITATQPKPTKAQLVEALISRARIAHDKVNEARGIKRDAIEAQVKAEAEKHFRASSMKDFDFNINLWHGRCSFTLSVENPKLKKLTEAMRKHDYLHFDRDATKKKIVESLAAPNPLLGNPDTAKALDTLLHSIMNPAAKLEDSTVDV
jgi:hypothetical protein